MARQRIPPAHCSRASCSLRPGRGEHLSVASPVTQTPPAPLPAADFAWPYGALEVAARWLAWVIGLDYNLPPSSPSMAPGSPRDAALAAPYGRATACYRRAPAPVHPADLDALVDRHVPPAGADGPPIAAIWVTDHLLSRFTVKWSCSGC